MVILSATGRVHNNLADFVAVHVHDRVASTALEII
jgi:hypothetical protein